VHDSSLAIIELNSGMVKANWAGALSWWSNQSPVHHFSGSVCHTSSHRCHRMSLVVLFHSLYVWNSFVYHSYVDVKKQWPACRWHWN